MKHNYHHIFLFLLSCLLIGCQAGSPPKHPNNICKIFQEYPSWYWSAKKTRQKWHVPISVQMAIMYQESQFRSQAKPKRHKLFGIIPWFRPTTASGYTQAVDETWREYIKSQSMLSGARDNFADATNFIGWYADKAHSRLKISRQNARNLYLAYHEGINGYRNRVYLRKKWLIGIAHKVQRRAALYRAELLYCEKRLPKEPWWHKIL